MPSIVGAVSLLVESDRGRILRRERVRAGIGGVGGAEIRVVVEGG